MTTRGIVYVATKHDRYLEEAFLSANSVKERFPDLPITLFTDLPRHPLCLTGRFDQIETIVGVSGFGSNWAEGLLNRVRAAGPERRQDVAVSLDALEGDLHVRTHHLNRPGPAFLPDDRHALDEPAQRRGGCVPRGGQWKPASGLADSGAGHQRTGARCR